MNFRPPTHAIIRHDEVRPAKLAGLFLWDVVGHRIWQSVRNRGALLSGVHTPQTLFEFGGHAR